MSDSGEKTKKYRFRNHEVKLRLSDEEYDYLQKKYKHSDCQSINDFYLELLKKSNIYKMNWDDFNIPKISAEISKIGSNVNQIRKKLNQTGNFYDSDMEEIQKGFHRIWQLVESIQSRLRSSVR